MPLESSGNSDYLPGEWWGTWDGEPLADFCADVARQTLEFPVTFNVLRSTLQAIDVFEFEGSARFKASLVAFVAAQDLAWCSLTEKWESVNSGILERWLALGIDWGASSVALDPEQSARVAGLLAEVWWDVSDILLFRDVLRAYAAKLWPENSSLEELLHTLGRFDRALTRELELQRCLEQEPDRTIVQMWRDGHAGPEIAAMVGLAPRTVQNKVSQFRKDLGEEVVPYHR